MKRFTHIWWYLTLLIAFLTVADSPALAQRFTSKRALNRPKSTVFKLGILPLKGDDTLTRSSGMELPFFEDWDQGSFDANEWLTDGTNWIISSQVGNDAPSAEFNWDPQLQNYSSALTSAPMNINLLTEGKIWLDYDIKLDSRNSTGNEKILVEVFDGQSWTEVSEVSNANGSFDFANGHYHVDISDIATGIVFQVRFNAVGVNSFNILDWYVDNISIYRECDPPTDLWGDVVWYNSPPYYGAAIYWNAPEQLIPLREWIHWDDGTNSNSIGIGGNGTFSIAARWDAGMLYDWKGDDFDSTYITRLQFFISDNGFSAVTAKIWTGANASNLIWSSDVTSSVIVGDWTVITLDTSIRIDASQEYWVGYTVDEVGANYPAGVDAGPATVGYGDMVSTDGVTWDPLSSFGLDYNWNVEFYAEEMTTSIPAPAPMIDNTKYTSSGATFSQGSTNSTYKAADRRNDRNFQGYFNIYKADYADTLVYSLYDTIPFVNGQVAYSYYDYYPHVIFDHYYFYKVSAVYADSADSCEPFAYTQYPPIQDYISIFITDGVDNPPANNLTNLYPNPAKERVTITSGSAITHVMVVNDVGQVIDNEKVNNLTTMTLNTTSYQTGVYIVKINTKKGLTAKRIILVK